MYLKCCIVKENKINKENGFIMLQLLAATGNQHKIVEFRTLLADLNSRVNIVTPDSIPNFPELIEDGKSFEENAERKAEQASAYADMAAFADDSGLEVEALDGAPGIYSARYAGEGATDAQRIEKLLNAMKGQTNRKARFVCVIAIAYRGDDVALFRGEVRGTIADSPRGTNGFGYDPVFIPEGYDKTFGELPQEIKDAISHRANAISKAVKFIRAELDSMDDFEFV